MLMNLLGRHRRRARRLERAASISHSCREKRSARQGFGDVRCATESTGQLFGSIRRREPEARMECERGAWGHETAQGRQLREANDAEHQHQRKHQQPPGQCVIAVCV